MCHVSLSYKIFTSPRRLSDVCGSTYITRTKKMPVRFPSLVPDGGGTIYQRYVWDMEAMQVLTDHAQGSEFVLD